ncbi:MAG: hypothetical protein NVSMB13_12060 [Mycobacteriales bacterium]
MTRRDDVGELLEGDGVEDTLLDGDGDNTGDAGDRYRGALRFGTTAAEESRGESLEQLLAEEEPDAVDDWERQSDWPDRELQRDIAGLLSGSTGSHSRTDPDLLGTHPRTDLSAEEAALHVISQHLGRGREAGGLTTALATAAAQAAPEETVAGEACGKPVLPKRPGEATGQGGSAL